MKKELIRVGSTAYWYMVDDLLKVEIVGFKDQQILFKPIEIVVKKTSRNLIAGQAIDQCIEEGKPGTTHAFLLHETLEDAKRVRL